MRTAVGFPCPRCEGKMDRLEADVIACGIDEDGNVALRLHCGRCEMVWWARRLVGEDWQTSTEGLPT